MIISFLNKKISAIHSAALILGAAGFFSKVLALLRDRLLASHFGASRELDIYYAAFQIPDFIYTVLLVGAVSMAVIPLFTESLQQSKEEAEKFINALFTFFIIFGGILILLAIFFAPLLLPKIFPGFSGDDLSRLVVITRMLFLSPFFLGISGIFSAPVQANHRFIAYALSAIVYNIGIILGIIFLVPYIGIYGLAGGVLLGALSHMMIQIITYGSLGFSLYFVKEFFTSEVRKVLYLGIPRIMSLSFSQISAMIFVGIASTLRPGSIAVFQFAKNLGFLPIGIFAVSYATALFPRLSQYAVEKDRNAFIGNIFFGMRTIFLWIVPIGFLFVVLRAHIVRTVLGAGAFDWSDTRLTAAAFAIISVALLGECLDGLFLRGFYALKATWVPLLFDFIALITGIGSAFFFVRLLQNSPRVAENIYALLRISDLSGGEVVGVVLGSAIGTLLNAALLGLVLFFWIKKTMPNVSEKISVWQALWLPIIKIIVSAYGAALTAYATLSFLSHYIILDTFKNVFMEGLIAGILGLLVYGLLLYILKSKDFIDILQSFQRKLFSFQILPHQLNGDKHTLQE